MEGYWLLCRLNLEKAFRYSLPQPAPPAAPTKAPGRCKLLGGVPERTVRCLLQTGRHFVLLVFVSPTYIAIRHPKGGVPGTRGVIH